MKEDLLHYLWRFKKFNLTDLKTTDGETLQIIDFGEYNSNAGADFTNAKIQVGTTFWAGNIEMHIKSADWLAHAHDKNKAYNAVILHVVFDNDTPIFRQDGTLLPCLELKDKTPDYLISNYLHLLETNEWIPCAKQLEHVNLLTWASWTDRLLVERIEQKCEYIKRTLANTQYNWEETFYRHVARNFGVKVNDEPFELLAARTPMSLYAKHRNSLFQIESLIFGQAGMLPDDKAFEDDYPRQLQKEYQFLQKKYQLQAIEGTMWHFLRLRPANFPTIRLAQFAILVQNSAHLFSKVLEVKNIKSLEQLFACEVSSYWETHFVFDKISKPMAKNFGKQALNLLIINTIVPFLYLYGKEKDLSIYKERALSFLEEIKEEKNSITTAWQQHHVKANSAYQSQALIQLKTEYCDKKLCLQCAIGHKLMNKI